MKMLMTIITAMPLLRNTVQTQTTNNILMIFMEADELFLDEDMEQIESMRASRKKLKEKDFAKLLNKKDLSTFEMDEIFCE